MKAIHTLRMLRACAWVAMMFIPGALEQATSETMVWVLVSELMLIALIIMSTKNIQRCKRTLITATTTR